MEQVASKGLGPQPGVPTSPDSLSAAHRSTEGTWAGAGELPRCGKPATARRSRVLGRHRLQRFLIPLAIAIALAVLFVGLDVARRHILPNISTGLHHALLTIWAGVVTVGTSLAVYLVMRQQRRWLSRTAEQLTRVLETYQTDRSARVRFENPHLVHCRQIRGCEQTDCPMYDLPGERCWQVMSLGRAMQGDGAPGREIQKCHECDVHRMSCPDRFTELGESFNNLLFLLEEESEKLGRMRSQMVEKEKMVAIGQIAAGIAHEVGNPLSSISSIVQMMKRNGSGVETTEQLDLIETHIQRISTIVRQMVTLARPGPQRWELVHVGQALEEVIQLIGFDRRARNVKIVLEPIRSVPRTYAMRGQLQQVFINLSLNAFDAMPDGGTLTLRATSRPRSIVVEIEDTGSGIDSAVGRRIFEPFFTTKQPGEGTGLGLAVSYSIVQKHGGRIDVRSQAGKGTVFTIDIPILDKPPEES